ncbi:MAG: allophanate hydrolase [Microbacterium sp.]|uniref:allophanate hydrolase n=1 Tax=Microbacterium sp. TaxID=51671 RepID=UPI00271CF876|nr:allophanate hydrolase [Microbacterium sp.]MDO8383249.1 allophanate hydrolase [Microbacterium sp.]
MSVVLRVQQAYERIAAADRPEVWIALREEPEVLAEARVLDSRVAAGERLPLAGVLVAVKDNIDVAGLATTAGCPAFAFAPEVDAPSVARLRAAGAIVLGKTNLDQFATGLVGTRSPYGAVRNAWRPDRISGGSSSGSAVAVALSFVDIALGTDTAGSGRVPAALNGIFGIKPTVGLVPTTGVVPACWSIDVVTVFARDLGLGRLAAETMEGADGIDPLIRVAEALPGLEPAPRVAIPTPEHLEGLAPGWVEAFRGVVDRLAASGVEIVEVDIAPLLEGAALLYGGAFVAERTAAVGDFIRENADLVGSDIDPTVATIVGGGEKFTAVDAFRDRERLRRLGLAGARLLEGTAALLTPTTTWHPTLTEVAADPIGANARMGRYTNFANLLDYASLALPAGTVDGFPFGVMLTAPAFSDRRLAELARRIVDAEIDILVVGAHLTGQPLNHQLIAAGGRFSRAVRTAASYRLHALPTVPPKPGLRRVDEGRVEARGVAIAGEVWTLPAHGFGSFVAALPQPMTIGRVTLEDGSSVAGFLAEPVALEGAADISAYGGWVAYLRRDQSAE